MVTMKFRPVKIEENPATNAAIIVSATLELEYTLEYGV
jgi:hypothetical protein